MSAAKIFISTAAVQENRLRGINAPVIIVERGLGSTLAKQVDILDNENNVIATVRQVDAKESPCVFIEAGAVIIHL